MSSSTIDAAGASAPAPADALDAALAAVTLALADVVDMPTFALDDTSLRGRLTRTLAAQASVGELLARLVREVDDRDLATRAGASSTRAYLQAAHRMSRGVAVALVAGAQVIDNRTEPTRRAWAAGEISCEQAHVIARAVGLVSAGVDDTKVEMAQLDLVSYAKSLNFPQLQHVANHVVEVIDPDGADAALAERLEAEEARAMQATTFRGRCGLDGIARFSGRLPNAQYSMLTKALEACAAPRRASLNRQRNFIADDEHGVSPVFDVDGDHTDAAVDGPLTYQQRIGRALIELIEHLPVDELPQHGVANATIVVTIDAAKLATGVGQTSLDTGDDLSVSQARRLACNAGVLPAVLDGDSKILDLGTSQRLFSRSQRLALAVRDKGCVWPACDRPPAWCEAHHITPWSHGGATDLGNGCLLCSFHHHLAHDGSWSIVAAADGAPELVPPAHVDPDRRSVRHARFKLRPG